jgi:hypothetical protein
MHKAFTIMEPVLSGFVPPLCPFAPYQYNLTEILWREDKEGSYIGDDIERKAAPGDISRRGLEVVKGTNGYGYYLPMDSYPESAQMKQYTSRDDLPIVIVKGSGDFAPVMMRCLMNRGGHATTNALPVFQTTWICGSKTNEDIFILDGDHFAQIQNLLQQACGKPDGSIRSSADAGGNCSSTNYAPAQIGVFLNLSRTWDDSTIVSIIGTQKP